MKTLFFLLLCLLGCRSITMDEPQALTYHVELVEGTAYCWFYISEDYQMIQVFDELLPWQMTVVAEPGMNMGVGVCPDDNSTMAVKIVCNGETVVSGEATGNEPVMWYWRVE